MIDAHVHIERGPYTIEWLGQFVDQAVKRGIDELCLLEHSHRFREFSRLYSRVADYSPYQGQWLKKRMNLCLDEYKRLIEQSRDVNWPVKVRFGLEICYIEGMEEVIEDAVKDFAWDFLTCSVHWIDNWGFDHRAEFWQDKDIDSVYDRYYIIMAELVKSGLFSILAHPDSIKCFGHYSSKELTATYAKLAELLKRYQVKVEQSAGLHINYGHPELGMNKVMLDVFKNAGVDMVTASDAHRPEDVGRYIKEMNDMLR